jgi:hypothetical protein
VDVVVLEVTLVGGTVRPLELALAILLPILVLTLILTTIRPDLNTLTILLVILPLTRVLSTIRVDIYSDTLSLIIPPHALIHITIRMDQTAFTIGEVISIVPLIVATIHPLLPPPTMTLASLELSNVHHLSLKLIGAKNRQLLIRVIILVVLEELTKLSECLKCP